MLLKKLALFGLIAASLLSPLVFAQDGSPVGVTLEQVVDGPVLEPGIHSSPGDIYIWEADIVFHDGLYYAYYISGENQQQPVTVSYATSPDGLTWTAYENNPIFGGDDEGFDLSGVKSPQVFVQDDGTWVMYYEGIQGVGLRLGKGIGMAIAPAPEGPWERLEDPVFTVSDNGRAWDANYLTLGTILYNDEGYVLYYGAFKGAEGQIGMSMSEDGINWTRHNDPETDSVALRESDPVFMVGERDAWDSNYVGDFDVWQSERGYEMLYTATGDDLGGLGYAFSTDGIHWERYSQNPILQNTGPDSFSSPSVIDIDGVIHVYYTHQIGGFPNFESSIELAALQVEWD
jgi:predicted GH43/DUF377 family glycosyl hydrolase